MKNLFSHIRTLTERHPDKQLFCFLDDRGAEIESYTYASFLKRVEVIASHLRARNGLNPEDRVLLMYPPGLEIICAMFGCIGAGLIPVPVGAPAAHNSGAAVARIENIAIDCSPALLLTTCAGQNSLMSKTVRAVNASFRTSSITNIERLSSEDFELPRDNCADLNGSGLFILQYTSGSTSEPKGVMVSIANIFANCAAVVDHQAPVAVSWLPQHHDMGLLGYYVYILLSGGSTYGFSPSTFVKRPLLWLETITRYRATASSAPNFAYALCLREKIVPSAALSHVDLSSLRFLMVASEPIDELIFREFRQRFEPYGLRSESFFCAYGLAENTLAVSSYGRQTLSVDRIRLAQGSVSVTKTVSQIDRATHIVSCGRPLRGNSVRIVGHKRHPCGEREVGEIWVTGESKCLGYWNDNERSQLMFNARIAGSTNSDSKYLRTGDLGFLHEGELYVCGRQKDMIIFRGENYFPQDIEVAVERACPSVRPGCVAAFATGDGRHRSLVVVIGVRKKDAAPDARAILIALRNDLNVGIDCIGFVPARSIPKTSSGKIMRYMVKQMWISDEFLIYDRFSCQSHAADDSIDATLSVFAELMRKYSLKGDESYTLIEAGVDSLDLINLIHGLKELVSPHNSTGLTDRIDVQLVQDVSIAKLFGLARHIEQMPEDAVTRLASLIEAIRGEHRARELDAMHIDSVLTLKPLRRTVLPAHNSPHSVLISGGTGFLGPFLLRSLLEQTDANLHVLVRAPCDSDAAARLRSTFVSNVAPSPQLIRFFDARVRAIRGDLRAPQLGMTDRDWSKLANEADTIYHNGANVNYVLSYAATRPANVLGTGEILRLACQGAPKSFNYISTTFIFGWATKEVIRESDRNANMNLLDFGYSQSKWVAEQRVYCAQQSGLKTRVFRPALLTPTLDGAGNNIDITIRLICFMIKHGISVNALNQVSLMPADIAANNIVAIANQSDAVGKTFHVTRDEYTKMSDITDIISASTGRSFRLFSLSEFVPEVIRRCTKDDLLFPLLDFLVGSIDNISAMEFKRYDSCEYQCARDRSPYCLPDPPLTDTVDGMLHFMRRKGILS